MHSSDVKRVFICNWLSSQMGNEIEEHIIEFAEREKKKKLNDLLNDLIRAYHSSSLDVSEGDSIVYKIFLTLIFF